MRVTSSPCLLTACLLLAACGSDDEGTGGSGGTGGPSSTTSTSGTGGGGDGGGTTTSTTAAGGSGGASGLEECSTNGLTPPSGPYACGSVGCRDDQVCVEFAIPSYDPGADECLIHFCADVPPECTATPTCECLEPFLDYQNLAAPTCVEEDGHLRLEGDEHVPNPPWSSPACPAGECQEGEGCWGCFSDGFNGFWQAPNYECAAENPSVPGLQSCSSRGIL